MNLQSILESLLFVVGDEGLSFQQTMEILDIDEQRFNELLDEIQANYKSENRGNRERV